MRLPDWIYATPNQEAYIARLRRDCAKYGTAKWPLPKRRLLREEASAEINMLKVAIEEGKNDRR